MTPAGRKAFEAPGESHTELVEALESRRADVLGRPGPIDKETIGILCNAPSIKLAADAPAKAKQSKAQARPINHNA